MKNILFGAILLVLLSCEKESSVGIPLHENSYSWTMGNTTRYFVNSIGDSIQTDSVYSKNFIVEQQINEYNYQYESYLENVFLDSVLQVSIQLEAQIKNNVRQDLLMISGKSLQLPSEVHTSGIAAVSDSLSASTAIYHDSLVMNNYIYYDLYSTTSLINGLSLFISPNYSLVGFVLNTDTFNLVN